MNYKQIYQIEKENKNRILKTNPNVPERSGIYFLLREDDGIKHAYIGQSVNILKRLAEHLRGYQYIDLSLKKYGLYSESNPSGYKVNFLEFPREELDEMEQKYIKLYANAGYQLKNKTSGSQGEGKKSLDNGTERKGYLQGVAKGYLNARKDVAHLFKLHLDYKTKKDPPTVNQKKAAEKFNDFLDWENKN